MDRKAEPEFQCWVWGLVTSCDQTRLLGTDIWLPTEVADPGRGTEPVGFCSLLYVQGLSQQFLNSSEWYRCQNFPKECWMSFPISFFEHYFIRGRVPTVPGVEYISMLPIISFFFLSFEAGWNWIDFFCICRWGNTVWVAGEHYVWRILSCPSWVFTSSPVILLFKIQFCMLTTQCEAWRRRKLVRRS